MPIDPSIILQASARPAQLAAPDPMERYAKIMAIQNGMGQQDLQGIQLQQARDGLDSSARLRALFSTNPKATADDVMGIDPKTGMAMRKQEVDNLKTRAETEHQSAGARKQEIEAAKTRYDTMGQAFGFVRDNPTVENAYRAIDQLAASGILKPEEAARAKATTPQDPAQIRALADQHFNSSMSAAQQVESQQRAATLTETTRHNKVGEVETGRHNTSTETNAAGQLNVARSRLQMEKDAPKGQYDSERGVLVDPRTAVSRPVVDAAGNPIAPKDKPLTESQGKATGMALRAQRANDIINELETAGETNRGIIKQAAGHLPLVGGGAEMAVNMLPGFAGGPSGNQQKVEQARRDFINAALRVESGASISPSEFQNAERQYFPMPGDTDDVLAQKRQARQNEIDGLKLQSGPGEKKITSLPTKVVKIAGDDGYNALPKGARYAGPDGIERTK